MLASSRGICLRLYSESFTSPEVQTPKDTVEKLVKVQNTGSVPCFVRVYLDLSDSRLSDGKVRLSADGTNYFSVQTFQNADLTDWEYCNETNALGGYFYYKKVLEPNEETSALLTIVKTDFDDVYDISDFDVIVYSEVVQTAEIDADDTVYTSWRDAWENFLHIT